jgi:hypothetical protein
MIKLQRLLLLFSLFILHNELLGQDTIHLTNPSFEDTPRAGSKTSSLIKGWSDCGFPDESPADIHPTPNKAWGVRLKAKDGLTYLGIVARYNLTWEAVSQKLTHPLDSGKCYKVAASLALVNYYQSPTKRLPNIFENFSNPLILQIWGGTEDCHRGQLLAKSLPVNNSSWKEFSFFLHPHASWNYLLIEAFYYFPSDVKEEDKKAYNGHILVDNLSPIIELECK